MYFLIYKTINKINGKCYVGSHKTENLDDGYFGSGKYLKAAIKKHGLENFVREILFQFDNSEDMYAKEAEIVNEDFLMNENTYNLKVGGFGGFDHINKDEVSRIIKNKKARISADASILKKYGVRNPSQISFVKKKISSSLKLAYSSGKRIPNLADLNWSGRKHSEETLKKMRESQKGKQSGEKNSQFGKRWINNGTEETKLNRDQLKPKEWNYGRLK